MSHLSQLTRLARLGAAAAVLTAWAVPAQAQLTLYAQADYRGAVQSLDRASPNLDRNGNRQRAASAMVRGERWEVCEDARFRGRCMVLREGRYPSLQAMGLNYPIRSVREIGPDDEVGRDQYAPLPAVAYDERRRRGERLYEARVVAVRAVVGPPEQRCWTDRETVQERRGDANVGGAIAGALLGGIIGHQIGGGSGRDIATVGGVVAGAAIGSNVHRDRNGRQVVTRDVRRCDTVPNNAAPEYWDVSYVFRGTEHHIQTRVPPGETITVNRQGEPRV